MSTVSCKLDRKSIDDLPDEILEYILGLVSQYKDLDYCSLVNRKWLRLSRSVSQHSKTNLYRSVLESKALWRLIATPDSVPTITKRYSHSAICFDSLMFVFGGCTSTCTTFNDLWTFDLTTRQWVRPYTSGCYPSPKACATMCSYKNRLILFGGWSHPPPYPLNQTLKLFNELHTYDIQSKMWDTVNCSVRPPAMAGHSSTVHGNLMVVFGGRQKMQLTLHTSSNDVWCLDLEVHTWRLQETTSPKPAPRYGQSQVFLNDENLLIIGGCSNVGLFDDVWVLNMVGPVWRWRKVLVKNSHWSAPNMWCHPACKVEDLVVVFSCGSQNKDFGPTARYRNNNNNSDSSIPPEVINRQASQGIKSRPPSVTSHQGVLGDRSQRRDEAAAAAAPAATPTFSAGPARPSTPEPSPSSSKTDSFGVKIPRTNELQLAAFRDDVQNMGSKNRQRQLECLHRLEERIKKMEEAVVNPSKPSPSCCTSPPSSCPSTRLNMYTLEIAYVLVEDGHVCWRPPRANPSGPSDTMLYSVVRGKGELVLFGGVQNDSSVTFDSTEHINVSNLMYFISPPRTII